MDEQTKQAFLLIEALPDKDIQRIIGLLEAELYRREKDRSTRTDITPKPRVIVHWAPYLEWLDQQPIKSGWRMKTSQPVTYEGETEDGKICVSQDRLQVCIPREFVDVIEVAE